MLTLAPLTGATSSLTTYSVSQSDCGHTSSTREFSSYHRINRNETTAMESSVTDSSLGAEQLDHSPRRGKQLDQSPRSVATRVRREERILVLMSKKVASS